MSETQSKERAGARAVLFVVLGLALLAGLAYAAAFWSAGDRVPRGTTVSGVEIGGQTAARAEDTLRDQLPTADAITFEVDGAPGSVAPDRAGLSVDYASTVEQAGPRRSWDPRWLWDYFTGGDSIEPVVRTDQARLDGFLQRLQTERGRAPVEGTVRFKGARYVVTDPQPGVEVDRAAALATVTEGYLTGRKVEIPVTAVEPDIDAADVRAAVDNFANPAVSGPVTLRFGDSRLKLTPRQFVPALSLEPGESGLDPALDEQVLGALLEGQVADAGAPVDATVRLVDGRPRVIPGKPGVGYDPDDVFASFLEAVAADPDHRVLEVPATVRRPDFTTKEARALDIKERVSTFTTYYPHADYRNTNIGRAAELIDGTVLKPGDTFSLNDIVGERTRENGFTEGYVIKDGIIVADLGGGVSQIATTTFNAMFFAGLEDIEHKPHSFYIDRYPVGREATVAWGAVDLRFRNDTPDGVLVHATVTPSTWSSSGVVTVSMYSTKYWDITARTGERYNITPPKERRVDTLKCHAATGYSGFDIDVWRDFRRAGSSALHHTEKFHTTYIPSDTVICTNPDHVDDVS